MSPIEAALGVVALVLPLHLFLQWQLSLLCNPGYLRRRGVVIRREEILQHRDRIIGHLRGTPIYGTVTFMGMEYRFDRVVSPCYKHRIGERELYIEPGLLYVTD